MKEGIALTDELEARLRAAFSQKASPRHVTAIICKVNDIPSTRSGKITELAVRDIVHGRAVKNSEALANLEVLEEFKNHPELALRQN